MMLFASCTEAEKPAQIGEDPVIQEPIQYVKADTASIAVLAYDPRAYWIFEECIDSCIGADLKPHDLDVVETLVQQAIEDYMLHRKVASGSRDPHAIGRDGYVLQLVAITLDGEKLVWVNAACGTGGSPWKTQILMVKDGGGCFYRLNLNLNKKTYYGLRVNGVA